MSDDAEEKRGERFRRWQRITMDQLSYTQNLILTLTDQDSDFSFSHSADDLEEYSQFFILKASPARAGLSF